MPFKDPSRHRWGWRRNRAETDSVVLKVLGAALVVGSIALRPTHAIGSDIAPTFKSLEEAEPFLWLRITSSPMSRSNHQQGPLVAESSSEMHSKSGFSAGRTDNTYAQLQEIFDSAYRNSPTTGINVNQLIRGDDIALQYAHEIQSYFSSTGPSLFDHRSQKHSRLISECNFDLDVREALGKNILCGSTKPKGHVASRPGAVETREREVPLPAAAWAFGFALLGFVVLANRQHS